VVEVVQRRVEAIVIWDTMAEQPRQRLARGDQPLLARLARSLEMESYSRLAHQADTYFTVFTEPQWEDLERVVPRLLALDPGQPEGHYLSGFLAVMDGRHADALVSFNRALQIDPDCVRALLGRADAHAGLGDNAASEADYNRAVELNPNIADGDEDGEEEDEE
jgi:tetratricopeptide (TPR) repeat protein